MTCCLLLAALQLLPRSYRPTSFQGCCRIDVLTTARRCALPISLPLLCLPLLCLPILCLPPIASTTAQLAHTRSLTCNCLIGALFALTLAPVLQFSALPTADSSRSAGQQSEGISPQPNNRPFVILLHEVRITMYPCFCRVC